MIRRTITLLILLMLIPTLAFAQDEDDNTSDIAYLRLNSNFSVPEIRGWDVLAENEAVLFSREDIDAQIYVRIVDTLDTNIAISTALADLEQVTIDETSPLYEGRIGRNNGTWSYIIYSEGDTSVTAYALLKSNQVYVVLFAEESPDYDAYHLAIRSTINEPVASEINTAINLASFEAIATINDSITSDEPISTRNPVADNLQWLEATYDNDITTASYLYDGIVYTTIVQGNSAITAELSDAFDSVFLGFVITPDNIEYLYLGLAFSAAIILVLLGSMVLRYQNIKKDLLILEHLEDE
ncbi:MAG: hypothetical protein Phog2KO_41990 [Phototrophicaceae bacterium]